jgi:hypothetical protein
LDPIIERRLGHADLRSEFPDRPFVGSALDLACTTPVLGCDDAGPGQQMVHHGRVERVASLGGSPPLAIEHVRDHGEAMAGLA